jgi:hypothetical protein
MDMQIRITELLNNGLLVIEDKNQIVQEMEEKITSEFEEYNREIILNSAEDEDEYLSLMVYIDWNGCRYKYTVHTIDYDNDTNSIGQKDYNDINTRLEAFLQINL